MVFHIRTSKYRHVFCDPPKPEVGNNNNRWRSKLRAVHYLIMLRVVHPQEVLVARNRALASSSYYCCRYFWSVPVYIPVEAGLA
jgi:hypothetical protein